MGITKEQVKAMSQEDIAAVLDEFESREKKGDKVVNPGRNIGTLSSSVSKSFGGEALERSHDKKENFSAWTGWRDPSLQMDEEVRSAMLAKSWQEAGYQGKAPWGSFGEFLKDGWTMKNRSMAADFARKHAATWEGLDATFMKARGMSTTSGEDGGFLINPEIAPTIDALFDPSDLPGKIDTLPTNSTLFRWPRAKDLNRNDGFRHGGVLHKWIDEAEGGSESRPKLTFTELRMKKLVVFVFMTTEIMNDTPYAVEQFVRNAVREEINFALARAIVWGAGGVEPIGFANSNSLLTVAKENAQAADTFTATNALDMTSRMWKNSRSNAMWLHHQSLIPQIGKMSLGGYPVSVNIQTGGIQNPVISTLLNRPLVESELCSPLGDAGDVYYVDPKMYKAISQSNVREDISMHVEFMTDQHCLRFIFRFDGAPLYDAPITPFKAPGATVDPPTQSSFIRLAARA
jgi:HK97 family phage major capsid protein